MPTASLGQRLLCPTLIARDEEQAALAEALAAAARGRGQAILVGGEAGVGKTAVLRAFAENARATAARVLVGECIEVDARRALGPFMDIVEQARRASNIRPEDAQRLAPLLRGEADPTLQRRLFDAFARLLAGVARAAPLIVAIEDLHWADDASHELFAYLARRSRNDAVILIGTYRTDELHRRHPLRPLIADLVAARAVQSIAIAPLRRPAVTRFIRETLRLDHDPATGFRDALDQRCEGNPFFMEEVLETLRSKGAISLHEGQWIPSGQATVGLPDSIRDSVDRRAATLSDEARRVLRIAAVIGQRFDFEILSQVSGLARDQLTEHLRAAIALQLIVETNGFAFRHALTRESVASDLLEPERRMFHLRIARAIEGSTDPHEHDEALAYHFDAAGESEPAARYHLEAAGRARSVAAFTQVVDHLSRALALAGPGADTLVLQGELAQAEAWVDPARGERAWRDVADRALVAGRALEAGQAFAFVGALQVGSGSPEALGNLTRAIEMLEPLGATKQLAHAYDYLAQWHLFSGEREPGMKAAARAIEVAGAMGAMMRAVGVRVAGVVMAG